MPLTDAEASRWLGALHHRGPDGRGLWRRENVLLGHTRLAVRDPGNVESAQPMATPCGRYALAYNGELYDDAAERARLDARVRAATRGRGFRTRCDAETVLWALALDGVAALDRLRGMYALAFVDLHGRSLWLARDPLGVKPLVWSRTTAGVAFASEPGALTAHPEVPRRPCAEMLAAYLVTSRRTLGDRTLFEGVRSVEPGDVLRVDLAQPERGAVRVASGTRFGPPVREEGSISEQVEFERCAAVVEDSTRAHLVSDVPVCALLSGGLDSAILVRLATEAGTPLATWCSSGVEEGRELGPDPAFARSLAAELGTTHRDVPIAQELFLAEWKAHVAHLRQPLSTPNEIAISETSRAIRASGAVVTLSGEGADELFGGYQQILEAFAVHASLPVAPISAARFHLEVCAWTSPAALPEIVLHGASAGADLVVSTYESLFDSARDSAGASGTDLDLHLRVQRAVNLTSLLERLDAATMRHAVEGRTPFADQRVREYAESLPIVRKFRSDPASGTVSKHVLREAFRQRLPHDVVERPKASFPLPFVAWSAPVARSLAQDSILADWIPAAVVRAVADEPTEHWKLAWLLSNVALWLRSFDAPTAASEVIQVREEGLPVS